MRELDPSAPDESGRAGVGVATSSKEGAAQVKCIVDALKPLKLPSPGGYPAKVSFGL